MLRISLVFIFFLSGFMGKAQVTWTKEGRSILFTREQTPGGNGPDRICITPYGDHIIRIQTLRPGENFFPNDRYEMVESHDWLGSAELKEMPNSIVVSSSGKEGYSVQLDKKTFLLGFSDKMESLPFLMEKETIRWQNDTVTTSFVYDPAEHFTGLGHGYFGRAESVDLKGSLIRRNYGTEHHQQAPLIVPYYLSSKGYGLFVNSTFPNEFNFGVNDQYSFSLSGDARLDYFVILGPSFAHILDRYTQLTGRPRLPPKAFFGLALSDKGHDHNSPDPSDEKWWKNKIQSHRQAGFALDHIVNDNRWRAGGGQRCISYLDWDKDRYPDPAAYADWIKSNGLIATLDFNRCIGVHSEGWKPSFNLPDTRGIEFNTSAPDLTKKEVRDWFWNLFWTKSLDPKLKYPGDALWIDEFDEMGKAPLDMKFENGSTWKEMRNYWFFLIAKALVQQGWDKHFAGTKRPFVWVRGMTAGAQRYATLWSGDIRSTYADMKTQVRGLQLAGLSGFPYWGHDAGGFFLENTRESPNDSLYSQWSMAFGSFTPYWKPHGVGRSRWPLDRAPELQKEARLYSELRYQLIPYIYTYAALANQTGMPMARAMMLEFPEQDQSWLSDLQYMWGKEILVAPNYSNEGKVPVWFPSGQWYDFWTDQMIAGNKILNYPAPLGKLPLFVKAGSIIPMYNFALSTAFQHADTLNIHVYPGGDASFDLYEDDGVSENFLNKKEKRITAIRFKQSTFALEISPAAGTYTNAPLSRLYKIIFHDASKPFSVNVNGVMMKAVSGKQMNSKGAYWNGEKKTLTVITTKMPVSAKLVVKK